MFRPQGDLPVVVRGTLGAVPENNSKSSMLPTTKRDFAGYRPSTGAGARFGQLSQNPFFARHNPQPKRVKHIRGPCDMPICAVHDDGYMHYPRLRVRKNLMLPDAARPIHSAPARLPVQAINYHPQHINPSLQKHGTNTLDAKRMYHRYPFAVKERADPFFGLSLLDWPICAVNDDHKRPHPLRVPSSPEKRRLYSFSIPRLFHPAYRIYNQNTTLNSQLYPINTITGLSTYPAGLKDRGNTNMEIIPVTDSWREELRKLTDQAGLGLPEDIKEKLKEQPKRTSVYSAETGRLIPPPSRAMSRGVSRQRDREQFLHIMPEPDNQIMVMEMLCQILQVDSMAAVQSWLVSAPDNEKDLVLNVIRSALVNEDQYYIKPEELGDRTKHDNPLLRDSPLMSHPPSNMNLQNGYGDFDRPSPRMEDANSLPRLNTGSNGYSRYTFENGERSKVSSAGGQKQTMFDEEDHPALRQGSHKPDVFKVEHSPRQSPRPTTHSSARPLTQHTARPLTQEGLERAAVSPQHILRMSSTPRRSTRISGERSLVSRNSQGWRPEEALVA